MKNLEKEFLRMYPDASDIKNAFCPYRVCPIGAHSDHQYGKITGLAIDKGIDVVFVPTDNGIIEISSMNFEGTMQFYVNAVPKKRQNDWADYLRGATISLAKRHPLEKGMYALLSGSLPIGGLSSSAAVILAYLSALCKSNNLKLESSEIIEIALETENSYVGVSCGKLDQSCEIYSKKDHLLYLDTKDDSYELIPQNPNMPDYEIAVFFSGVERSLVGSKFNMRVDELKAASYALKAFEGLEYGKFTDTRLRDVPVEVFLKHKDKLPENWRKRAEHYYSEFERVEKGAEAWRNGDLVTFGKLSFESGYSSIYSYETGSDELKAIYDIMLETDGIYGGRFSGAGFKGCCMALIDPTFKESIEKKVTEEYLKQFPALKGKFSVHFCKSADGCKF
ncbi:MAG: GHMP kinase [Clostridia bacterium]|nr:GHMP kinase [Clostridia bacterium]